MESFEVRFLNRKKFVNSGKMYRIGAKELTVPDEVMARFKSAGAALFAHLKTEIDRIAPDHPGIVISSVYFGQYGVSGFVAFSAAINYARSCGLLVVCDDRVFVTADNADFVRLAYLAAPNGEDKSDTGVLPISDHGFDVDALTVSPDSEREGLELLKEAALAAGKEIIVPGAGQIIDN